MEKRLNYQMQSNYLELPLTKIFILNGIDKIFATKQIKKSKAQNE